MICASTSTSPGRHRLVRSTAAQLAHPCPNGGTTRLRICVPAADNARVFWAVEPLIIAAGADHTNEFRFELDGSSRCVVHDTVMLGRTRDDPAAASLRALMSVAIAGDPVFEDGIDTTLPGSHGPAGLNGNRLVSTVVAAGWTPARFERTMPLASSGAVQRSLNRDVCSAGASVTDAAAAWRTELLGPNPHASGRSGVDGGAGIPQPRRA
jgi:urease accessory protein